jgi:hypothetical protein
MTLHNVAKASARHAAYMELSENMHESLCLELNTTSTTSRLLGPRNHAPLGYPDPSWASLGSHGLPWAPCAHLGSPGLPWAPLGFPVISWAPWALLGSPVLYWAGNGFRASENQFANAHFSKTAKMHVMRSENKLEKLEMAFANPKMSLRMHISLKPRKCMP